MIGTLKQRGQKVALIDAGLLGDAASALAVADLDRTVLTNATLPTAQSFSIFCEPLAGSTESSSLTNAATRIKTECEADFGIAIGPIDRDLAKVESGESLFEVAIVGPIVDSNSAGQVSASTQEYVYRGHSSWRQKRAVKQVLNQLRFFLNEQTS